MAAAGFRVTYATLSADDEELRARCEHGLEEARRHLGQAHGSVVAGEVRHGAGHYETDSPSDRARSIGTFAVASERDIEDAVGAARVAQPEWGRLPWQELG